jgi:hypothetical protein
MTIRRTWLGIVGMLVLSAAVGAAAQQPLGSVRIPRAVMANGQSLAAGSYTVRVSADAVTPVVGQPAGSERWVEFVQGGQVKARELASVVPSSNIKAVGKVTPPKPGASRVELLRGAEYLRVWINEDGTHYFINLALPK